VKGIHEKDLSWKQFEKYFKEKYSSEKYFYGKTKEFYELRLGQLTIEEYINKFLELIRYVPYIKYEKVKVQRFISGLPQSYRDRIEFDEPKILEKTIQKARYCYEQSGSQTKPHEYWKKKNSLRFKENGFKSSRFKNYRKGYRMSLPTRSVYQQSFPSQSGNKPFGSTLGNIDNPKREPLKCWGWGEEHLLRDYPHRQQNNWTIYNIQEAITVNDVARSMPWIYAVVDNKQADHQASVVEMEGMISSHLVSIVIEPVSNLSYVAPHIVNKCKIQPVRHVKPWLVQLAIGAKIKVVEVVLACQFIMDGFPTQATLNVLPLGSYDLLIGMDLLATYKTKLDCYHKTLECENKEGRKITLQGIHKPVSVRQISTLQMKKYCRKGCSL
jgi:hypothetical protein